MGKIAQYKGIEQYTLTDPIGMVHLLSYAARAAGGVHSWQLRAAVKSKCTIPMGLVRVYWGLYILWKICHEEKCH